MRIYVIRHGYDDFEAGEASIGLAQVRDTASVLSEKRVPPQNTTLLHSPKYRPRQPAYVIQDRLDIPVSEKVDWLAESESSRSYSELATLIEVDTRHSHLILVTHVPNIEAILNGFSARYSVGITPNIFYASLFYIDTDLTTISQII
jgi:phosphohistidine phosphatase SixA